MTALALVAAYPDDVTTLVAHEPPLIPVLPDAAAAERARAGVRDAYAANGRGAGMAAFIAMTSWRGEFTDDYFAQPAPDPAQFGMPAEDDGSRDDPLLSDRSEAIIGYRPDFEALAASGTRIVIAVGEESAGTFTGRTSEATAQLLSRDAVPDLFACGSDVDEHVAQLRSYADAGYDEVYVQQIGPDKEGFFAAYEKEVLPALSGS